MRQRLFRICVAAALVAMSVSAALAQKADFSGTWVLDKSRSEGLPPGFDQTMTVKQAGDSVSVEAKVSGPQGEREIKDQFTLDGKEVDFQIPPMGGATVTKARRTPKWTSDGRGFDLIEDMMVDGPEGAAALKSTRQWRLSEDGKTLTVEVTVDGPRGVRKSKRVYARK